MLLLLAPVLLLLLRLSAVGFRLASLGGARDPHHGFALTPAPLAALVEGKRGQAGARGTVRRRRRRRRPTMVLLLMMMVGEGGGRDDGRGGGGFHRGRVLRGECARLRSRTGGEGARWVSGGPDEGTESGVGGGRLVEDAGNARGSAVGIFPSPASTTLSNGPTAGTDDGGVATPTARTGNGSARRAHAPARRILRASGAGT